MKYIRLIGAVIGAAACSCPGGALAAPSLRAQVTQRGDFVLVGNTLAQDCSSAQVPAPIVGTVGACPANHSNFGPDVFWRADSPVAGQATAGAAVGAANARTTAVLSLPPGAAVSNAYLYWGARPSSAGADGAVVIDRPGAGGFTAGVTALATMTTLGNNQPPPGSKLAYQAVADVTPLVAQNGSGAYRVSGVESVDVGQIDLPNLAVGWWMVVFYEDGAQPLRQLTLFDGLDYASVSTGNVTTSLSGFLVPNTGYTAHLGVVAYGGDSGFTGDQLLWNGAALSDAQNPIDDFFNGTRSFLGAPVSNAGDLPQLTGGPGSMSELDLDVVDITANVTPGETSATIQATTSGDSYFLGGFITSILSCPMASCGCLVDTNCGGPTSGRVCDNGAGGSFLCVPGCRGQGGNGCAAGLACTSSTTAIGACVFPGGGCDADSDCAAGAWCDESAHLCTAQLPNGSPMPIDPSHATPTLDGACTPLGALLVCESGVCDPKDDACGYADGDGPCTTATAPVVCRSGACSAAGTCVPVGGCNVDADCPSNRWCDVATHACMPKLVATPVPVCAHAGPCAQCASDSDCGGPTSGRVCDATAGTCGDGCRGQGGNGCAAGETCSSTSAAIGQCQASDGGDGTDGGGHGTDDDGALLSGGGLSCAVQPGRGDGGSGWLLGALAGAATAIRRRRR